ncbi:MAG: hypothetical protein JOZ38_09120 [Candidatus Eremiobacteraeota bacterium]|nr:hypothetical protein [Candidatus Eremiobacteraeota bacterium]
MSFDSLDGYLLDRSISKRDAIDAALREQSADPAAAPFYRALARVGERAADEALIALRLVLAGRQPDDASVRRLRDLAATAHKGGPEGATARAAYERELA